MEYYVCDVCSQILLKRELALHYGGRHNTSPQLTSVLRKIERDGTPLATKSFNPADSGYVEVNKRIEEFYAKHPEGAIRTQLIEHSIVFDEDGNRQGYVVMGAEAYRDSRDEAPAGTGFSGMIIPGATPYTNGSEIENAETSAVGRAIANMGFEVKKSVASADEIRAKEGIAPAAPKGLTALKKEVRKLAEAKYPSTWRDELDALGINNASDESALKFAKEILSRA